MEEKTFTKENYDKLKITCQKIIAIADENVDGSLMLSQLMLLGYNIKEFRDNPIVQNSGLI